MDQMYLITEWDIVRQRMVRYRRWFSSLREANSYIEYFGTAELYTGD